MKALGTPRLDYDTRMKKAAIDAFATHRVRSCTERSWLLQKSVPSGTSAHETFTYVMSAEIYAGSHRDLYVNGDIDCCVFAYGPVDVLRRVQWMATSDVAYYVLQKARIGLSAPANSDCSVVYDPEIATDQWRERVEAYLEERSPDLSGDALKQAMDDSELWATIRGYLDIHQDHHSMLSAIHNDDDIPQGLAEESHGIGIVAAPRVYYAWAAIRRLAGLLSEEIK